MSTIVCIGDSLIQGGSPWIARNLESRLAEKYPGFDIVNLGVGGQTSAAVDARKMSAPAWHPFRVIVWAGINDIGGIAPAATIASLQSMYTYFANLGTEVWALTITPNDNNNASQVTDRDTINSYIINSATGLSKVIDACSLIKDPNDAGNRNPAYADPLSPNHINDAGMALLVDSM